MLRKINKFYNILIMKNWKLYIFLYNKILLILDIIFLNTYINNSSFFFELEFYQNYFKIEKNIFFFFLLSFKKKKKIIILYKIL